MESESVELIAISIYGLISDNGFQFAKLIANDLFTDLKVGCLKAPQVETFHEFQWKTYVSSKKQELGNEFWAFKQNALIFIDDNCIGGIKEFTEYARDVFHYECFRPAPLLEAIQETAYFDYFSTNSKYDYVFMDITINEESIGRLLIELFSDGVPKTCKNFLELCTGLLGVNDSNIALSYQKSPIHRIVKDGWIQGGDIVRGRGDGGWSIYGETFEDESFFLKHDQRGILGMSNTGKHSNASQFYIILKEMSAFDTHFVAFGRIIEGYDVLARIENEVTLNERPQNKIVISNCGEFLPKS